MMKSEHAWVSVTGLIVCLAIGSMCIFRLLACDLSIAHWFHVVNDLCLPHLVFNWKKFNTYMVCFGMRRSPKRHPLAILRLTLGLTQKEMADLAGTATITIQSIESGKRPLSEKLGEHIAAVTGVQMYWLMAGDPKAPIVAEDGAPYTRKRYEENKELLFGRKHTQQRREFEHSFLTEALGLFLINAFSILRHGHSNNRLAWAVYKLQIAIDAVGRELGTEASIDAYIDQLNADHPRGGRFDAAVHIVKQLHARSQQH